MQSTYLESKNIQFYGQLWDHLQYISPEQLKTCMGRVSSAPKSNYGQRHQQLPHTCTLSPLDEGLGFLELHLKLCLRKGYKFHLHTTVFVGNL